jgi:hypothetical protein
LQAQQILQEKQKQNREDSPSTVAGPAPTLAAEASEELVEDVKDEKSFEEQLEAIKRSAKEQKALQEAKKYGPIDYDSPPPAPQQSSWTDNITTKVSACSLYITLQALNPQCYNCPKTYLFWFNK